MIHRDLTPKFNKIVSKDGVDVIGNTYETPYAETELTKLHTVIIFKNSENGHLINTIYFEEQLTSQQLDKLVEELAENINQLIDGNN